MISVNKVIEELENRHGDKNICSILCLQSGSSPEMIRTTLNNTCRCNDQLKMIDK